MATAEHSAIDLNGGFYTAAEAARLLGHRRPQRLVRWLSTPPKGEPLIQREYEKVGREHELSFMDLLEVRFLEHFRSQGISLQALRKAAKNARGELGVSHPFARSDVKFQSDRKSVFLETAKAADDRVFLNLMTKQIEIYDVIEQLLAKDLEFDASGLARSWRPEPSLAPGVIVAPAYAFGRPVVSKRHVPTETLFDAWTAEDGDAAAVAEWYGVSPDDVREAVAFEVRPLH